MKSAITFLAVCVLAVGHVPAKGPELNTEPLIKGALKHELPLPPKTSKLVVVTTDTVNSFSNGKRNPTVYRPAYLLEENKDGSISVLIGANLKHIRPSLNADPLWRSFIQDKKDKASEEQYTISFAHPDSFICAIQTAAIGDNKNAQYIWQCFIEEDRWQEWLYGVKISDLVKESDYFLSCCLYNHLLDSIIEQPSEWNAVSVKMTRLCDDFPKLNRGSRAQFLEDLKHTITNPPPETGSVEDLLVQWSKIPTKTKNLKLFGCRCCTRDEADASARSIVFRGYEALPDLIALLDDRRITAHTLPHSQSSDTSVRRLGELAYELAWQMAAGRAMLPRTGDPRAVLITWWKQRLGQDEYSILSDMIFRKENDVIVGVNECPSMIAAKKYSNKLNDICEEYEQHRSTNTYDSAIANMLIASDLPRDIVTAKLVGYAQRDSLGSRFGVLQRLATIDEDACIKLFLPLLRTLPPDIQTGEYWTSEESGVSHVAMELQNDAVWQAFLKVAKRSSIGLRMEMMNPLAYTYIGEKNRSRRLAFLAAFLDDEAVRTRAGDKRFEGPCAGFTINRLSVRNFAATQIAAILGIPENSEGSWNEQQWSELRQKVSEKLSQEIKK